MENEIILEVKNLSKYFDVTKGIFKRKKKILKAVDNVSFTIKKGETLGLVGESGCGKTTTGRTVLRLYDITEGSIKVKGQDISKMSQKQLKPLRKNMQMIFQDPYASLNPRMTVGEIVGEALDIHNLYKGKNKEEIIKNMLVKVGLVGDHINRYPHEFSGGQRQRIGIARALITKPDLIVCDEPISALDVSIQAQVINILEELREEFGLTYLFIAHDLTMVKHIATHIGVMYLGSLVEKGESNDVYFDPLHPYTQSLLSAVPIADPIKAKSNQRIILKGELPSPINMPKGCKFSDRCPKVMDICKREVPKVYEPKEGHFVSCHLYK